MIKYVIDKLRKIYLYNYRTAIKNTSFLIDSLKTNVICAQHKIVLGIIVVGVKFCLLIMKTDMSNLSSGRAEIFTYRQ